MGVSTSYKQLAGKLEKAGSALDEVPKTATKAASDAAADIIRAGSPTVLRNVGKKGGALLVRVRVEGGTKGIVSGVGPWPIIEDNTKPHTIPKARKRGGRKTLRLPDGSFRRSVHHPGTKGKHPFAKGALAAEKVVPEVYRKAEQAAMRSVFM